MMPQLPDSVFKGRKRRNLSGADYRAAADVQRSLPETADCFYRLFVLHNS